MAEQEKKLIVVGLTGASGAIYGVRLVEELLAADCRVAVLVSSAGRQVLALEADLALPEDSVAATRMLQAYFSASDLQFYAEDDFSAPFASGSAVPAAVVVCPCSMGSLARLAAGISGNLLERAADVALKERRQLVLVPRETPFSQIHLENMLRLARAGATILPAMPAFYSQPDSVAALVDTVLARLLQQLDLDQNLIIPWGNRQGKPE